VGDVFVGQAGLIGDVDPGDRRVDDVTAGVLVVRVGADDVDDHVDRPLEVVDFELALGVQRGGCRVRGRRLPGNGVQVRRVRGGFPGGVHGEVGRQGGPDGGDVQFEGARTVRQVAVTLDVGPPVEDEPL